MLKIHVLQEASRDRAARWHDSPEAQWSLLEWAGAMCGESGEAANIAKKIKRLESKMRSISKQIVTPRNDDPLARQQRILLIDDQMQQLKPALAKEVADAILYGICIFNELDVVAEDVLREVFNEKSEEYDFPERI